jgi:hypothetical protein
MKKYLNILALTVGASLVGAVSVHAQLWGYDGFNYTVGGSLSNAAPSSGDWKYNWFDKLNTGVPSSTVQSGSLSYSTLTTTGNSVSQNGAAGTAIDQIGFNSTFGVYANLHNPTAPGTLWMSYLWQSGNFGNLSVGGNNLFRQASLGFYQGSISGTTGNEYLDVGLPNISDANAATVNPRVSLWYGGHGLAGQTGNATAPNLQSSVAADNANVDFILIEMLLDNTSTTADTMKVWINPTLGADVTALTPDMTYSLQDLSSLNAIRFAANNNNATFGGYGMQNFDEVRIGNDMTSVETLTSAVPEPVSMVLLGFSSLSLLLFRRKN